MINKIDELLQMPYWIIDILPKQVKENSPGQYFKVEKYFLSSKHFHKIKQKHINFILKLNCYKDISINESEIINPLPEVIEKEMKNHYLYLMMDNAMILSEPDDTHLTLFNPSEELLELVKEISLSEGLYVWKPTI
ncbi:MAG: hypothetical protein IKE51_00900 [Solobacterium sp.]|nr:hypothetical protein [Solobacterium sp.]